ncbi:MAG: hypothetical protein H6908_05755 [Hyphomicrobiales bacterium]|nr:hypothetical protein [Hyphomicrobiales bacterium]
MQLTGFLNIINVVAPQPNTPLRAVILYSAGHLGSAILFNRLVKSPDITLCAIIKTPALPYTHKGKQSLRHHLKRTGWRFGWLMLWQRIVQTILYGIHLLFPARTRAILPGWLLAKRHQIPVYFTRSINSRTFRKQLRELAPDIVISAFCNQILKPEIIAIPRLGTLNVHPGWLPAYRGAMSYFWVLHNGEDQAGVSIHWIDEGIDTGTLLARRKISLKTGMTQQMVMIRSALAGSILLKHLLHMLVTGKTPASIKEESPQESSAYFPAPDHAAFDGYFNQHRFFRIRDTWRIITGARFLR